MFVKRTPGSWYIKKLLLVKENQTSHVNEFEIAGEELNT